jgi:hypothetical protein
MRLCHFGNREEKGGVSECSQWVIASLFCEFSFIVGLSFLLAGKSLFSYLTCLGLFAFRTLFLFF